VFYFRGELVGFVIEWPPGKVASAATIYLQPVKFRERSVSADQQYASYWISLAPGGNTARNTRNAVIGRLSTDKGKTGRPFAATRRFGLKGARRLKTD
jgi:hypothetical protein